MVVDGIVVLGTVVFGATVVVGTTVVLGANVLVGNNVVLGATVVVEATVVLDATVVVGNTVVEFVLELVSSEVDLVVLTTTSPLHATIKMERKKLTIITIILLSFFIQSSECFNVSAILINSC